ncbi:MAG TPA: hypothetical protein VF761_17110 [Gemmatimonadaceae bacterium]
MLLKNCADCGTPVLLVKRGRFCKLCRFKPGNRKPVNRRRYIITPAIEQKIRDEFVPNETGCAERLAKELGWHVEYLRGRARALGLTRPASPWTAIECKVLDEYAGKRSAKWIAEQINSTVKGANRSPSQVEEKMRRMGLEVAVKSGDYNAAQLAQCFGVAGHTVETWIAKEWLKAERSEIANGMRFPWVIHEADVVRFIFTHPRAFVLRKVDQTWFLDIMAEHVRAAVAAAEQKKVASRKGPHRAVRVDHTRERAWLA